MIHGDLSDMKNLLIVYHSQSGGTEKMAKAVLAGARHQDLDQKVDVRFLSAKETHLEDLLWCHGIIIGTPENFGYMSGAVKDFFDRTFYPAEGKVQGIPYCLFVSAGNDGTGAVDSVQRILKGYAFRAVCEPLIAKGEVGDDILRQCEEMGLAMATGLEAGIF